MSFEGWDPLLKIVISTYLIEQDLSPTTLLKETLTHVFFCKHWEVFKNTYSETHLRTATCFVNIGKFLKITDFEAHLQTAA